jgi:hypothetical protein
MYSTRAGTREHPRRELAGIYEYIHVVATLRIVRLYSCTGRILLAAAVPCTHEYPVREGIGRLAGATPAHRAPFPHSAT